MKKGHDRPKKGDEVIRLEDLAPQKDVQGGAGKRLFGERREPLRTEDDSRVKRSSRRTP